MNDEHYRIRDIDEDWMEVEFHHKVNVRRYNPVSGFKQYLSEAAINFQNALDHHIRVQVLLPNVNK